MLSLLWRTSKLHPHVTIVGDLLGKALLTLPTLPPRLLTFMQMVRHNPNQDFLSTAISIFTINSAMIVNR
jgi:hypothetical protein